jgi:TRAP-type uncharacterized transport system substrate-binding protein
MEPTPIFPEITTPMPMIAFDMALVTNVEVPDESVYKIVKTLHGKARELGDTFAGLRRFRPDAFYQEIRQWPPKEQ